jgi:tRNA pseudouridine55 synthase
LVDKPAGMTSHDVVASCRRIFSQRRVGHAGTLDPDATGLLVVGLGRVTRLLQFLTGLPKSYEGEIVLGVATSTLDASGTVTGRWDMSAVTLDEARRAAAALTGEIEQLPPMVSAVKVGGRRLHRLARAGLEVERPARRVSVSRFDLELTPANGDGGVGDRTTSAAGGEWPTTATPVLRFSVSCSSGTYVRSLAADLGAALGGGAHLGSLRRCAVGPWSVARAVALAEVSSRSVLLPASAVEHLESIRLSGPSVTAATHGRRLDRAGLDASGDGPWAMLDPDGQLVAVYRADDDRQLRPVVVLGAPGSGPVS